MKSCESYEIDLSSLLDGEAAPELAAAAVEHALGCDGCAAFFRAARRLDAAARPLADDPAGADEARAESLWLVIRGRAGAVPATAGRPPARWRALRAAALVAVGLGGGYWLASVAAATDGLAIRGDEGIVAARGGDSAPPMDERRFVALADELLGSDLRYQRAMLDVLGLVPALDDAEVGRDDESRPVVRAVHREDGPRAGLL